MIKPFKLLVTLRRRYLKKYPFMEIDEFQKCIDLFDEEANALLKKKIEEGNPLMVSKFGTMELAAIRNYKSIHRFNSLWDIVNYVRGRDTLWWWETLYQLNNNAGVFPQTEEMAERFSELMFKDIKEIDILGSYLYGEKDVASYYPNTIKVNLNGYYAPFLWKDPWTSALAGKKVLVIHPFEDSIKKQYTRKELLFDNPLVLPDFELITLKAVQSIANQPTEFSNWFEALDSMKEKINKIDFDVALIGCGAYGMPLAAHIKRMGKQAVHLASWVQFLFGITGQRWERDNPQFKHLINQNWIRPSADETPENCMNVELGCYW